MSNNKELNEEKDINQDTEENELKEHHFTAKFFKSVLNKDVEFVFTDGDKISGKLIWFDRWNIKLLLPDGEDCIIYRHAVKSYGKV